MICAGSRNSWERRQRRDEGVVVWRMSYPAFMGNEVSSCVGGLDYIVCIVGLWMMCVCFLGQLAPREELVSLKCRIVCCGHGLSPPFWSSFRSIEQLEWTL